MEVGQQDSLLKQLMVESATAKHALTFQEPELCQMNLEKSPHPLILVGLQGFQFQGLMSQSLQ